MKPTNQDLPINVGDVLKLAEQDYRYGIGSLRIRITAIGQLYREPDGAWLSLRGIELRKELECGDRIVSVRFSALAVAKRAANAG